MIAVLHRIQTHKTVHKREDMMPIRNGFIALLCALFFALGTSAATAQEDDLRALLATLPQSRTEDGAFVLGYPDAPITIIEFADFACPHCQNYRSTINSLIANEIAAGDAKLEFRLLPTAGGAQTQYAGAVAECAGELRTGGFWQAHELLYELAIARRYNETLSLVVAEELDINALAMLGCMMRADQPEVDSEFAADLGVNGTPAILVRVNDQAPTYITYGNVTYDRGGPPLEVISELIRMVSNGNYNPDVSSVRTGRLSEFVRVASV